MKDEIIDDIPFDSAEEQVTAEQAKMKETLPGTLLHDETTQTIGRHGAEVRDQLYTQLFSQYVHQYEEGNEKTRELREKYLHAIVVGLIVLAVMCMAVIVFGFVFVDRVSFEKILSITIPTLSSALTAVVAIPTVIAKHLFPPEKDHEIVEIVKSMIANDCEIRKIDSRENCKNCDMKGK